jgi:hypothetical protein
LLPLAQAGWDGNVDIQLGEAVAAAFAKAPGAEVHRFYFYAPAGTTLGATMKTTFSAVAATPLATSIAVFRGDGVEIPLGTTWTLKTKTIKGLVLAVSDEYYIEVKSTAGTGEYSIKTTAKFPSAFKVILAAAGQTPFAAIAGASVSATVAKNKGSTAYPSFNALTGRFGAVALPAAPTAKPPKTPALVSIKKVLLPWNSAYNLGTAYLAATTDVGAVVGTGAVTVSGTIASPAARHTWYLGPIDPPAAATVMAAHWRHSGHADARSEAFKHWDAAGVVEKGCARCHSSAGFQDFIGADGTADNRFDHPAAVNGVNPPPTTDGTAAIGVIDCSACHNLKATELDAVVFPSDRLAVAATGTTPAKAARPAVAMDLGPEARCMQCHQGRESTNSIDEYIAFKAPAATDDTVVAGLSFKNVHYRSAAATLYGGGARGAYQYGDTTAEPKLYDGLNPHAPEANSCVECHNPHSLEVEVALCAQCHVTGTKAAVASVEDLKNIRMAGSTADYDGDDNTTEGMYYELKGMADILYAAIQAYATTVAGTPIAYNADAYPYFAKAAGGSYTSWTPRLLRAAYNYNYYVKEPGNYAHNPKYMIEIIYDSIADLAAAGVTVPQLHDMHRSDPGHFMGESMAFRDWDAAGATNSIDRGDVSTSCAPCHSNGGFEFWQKYGLNTTVAMPAADGMECGTCHVGGDFAAPVPALKVVKTVTFPSPVATPVTITNSTTAPDTSFICMSCHRGRQSMATLDADIAARQAAGSAIRSSNVHYAPAGATLYGKDAKVAYMFGASTTYSAKWTHAAGVTAQCKYCHLSDHTFKAELKDTCLNCHTEAVAGDIESIRKDRPVDYNGVNGTTDTLKAEVDSFATALLAQMNVFAAANGLAPIFYSEGSFRVAADPSSASYTAWGTDPVIIRAAFNYNYVQKELGAWAHNTKFVLQVLYDSIDMLNNGALDGNVPVLTRPAAAK